MSNPKKNVATKFCPPPVCNGKQKQSNISTGVHERCECVAWNFHGSSHCLGEMLRCRAGSRGSGFFCRPIFTQRGLGSYSSTKNMVVATQIFVIFTPKHGEDQPNLTVAYFFWWVETFNHQLQKKPGYRWRGGNLGQHVDKTTRPIEWSTWELDEAGWGLESFLDVVKPGLCWL